MERTAEFMDPAIVWDASEQPALDIAGVYRGREAVLQWWREWLAAWETVEFDYELVDAGDRVVLLLDQRMRGRSTDIEVPIASLEEEQERVKVAKQQLKRAEETARDAARRLRAAERKSRGIAGKLNR